MNEPLRSSSNLLLNYLNGSSVDERYSSKSTLLYFHCCFGNNKERQTLNIQSLWECFGAPVWGVQFQRCRRSPRCRISSRYSEWSLASEKHSFWKFTGTFRVQDRSRGKVQMSDNKMLSVRKKTFPLSWCIWLLLLVMFSWEVSTHQESVNFC